MDVNSRNIWPMRGVQSRVDTVLSKYTDNAALQDGPTDGPVNLSPRPTPTSPNQP